MVALETVCSRESSWMFLPASNSLRIVKIWASVNRFFFIGISLKLKTFRLILNCPIFGGAYNLIAKKENGQDLVYAEYIPELDTLHKEASVVLKAVFTLEKGINKDIIDGRMS